MHFPDRSWSLSKTGIEDGTIDLVIAHKTKSDYGRSTGWEEYEKIFEMIVETISK